MKSIQNLLNYEPLQIALNAAFSSRVPVMKIYKNKTFNVSKKADGTKVSDGDIAAHDAIYKVLQNYKLPIISEENYQIGNINTDKFWLIDPIDGTREYISNGTCFSINISLIVENRPTVAVLLFPVHTTLYFAVQGEGAYKLENVTIVEDVYNNIGSIQKLPLKTAPNVPYKILIRNFSNPTSFAALGTKSHIRTILKKYPNAEVEAYEASIKFCLVAEGNADYYFHAKGVREWDVACGDLLVSESGGRVVLKNSQRQIQYGESNNMTLPAIQVFHKSAL